MPYRFRDDIATADVAFDAWGESREELFAAAAGALLATMVHDPERVERQEELAVSVTEDDPEMLLFSFLQELVFLKDARRLLLHADSLAVMSDGETLRVEGVLGGERIDPARHRLVVDVKAVTLHRFSVVEEDGIWRATVVLDV